MQTWTSDPFAASRRFSATPVSATHIVSRSITFGSCFGGRNELLRRHQPQHWIPPADQRLGARHRMSDGGHDRLQMQFHPTGVDRLRDIVRRNRSGSRRCVGGR